MALVLSKPPPKTSGNKPPKTLYTIHCGLNDIYAIVPPKKNLKISVVAFQHEQHANTMACMMEEYRKNQDWPLFVDEDSMILPYAEPSELSFLHLKTWNDQAINDFCAKYIFDLIIITAFRKTISGYSINGNNYIIKGTQNLYKQRFEELFTLLD